MKNDSGKDKLLFFLPSLAGGGAERTILNIITYLSKETYDIYLILGEDGGDYQQIVPEEITVVLIKKKHMRYVILSLSSIIRKIKPKICFSTMAYANIVLAFAYIFAGRPGKIILRESVHLSSVKLPLYISFFIPIIYNLVAHRIVALSYGVKEDLEKKYRINGKKISVIYNPLNRDYIDSCLEQSDIYFEKYTVVAVGRLTHQKGYDILLEAFADFCQDKNCQLIILGRGEENNHLQKYAHSLGIKENVHFIGFKKNPYKYMAAADCFVLSSRFEGFGHVLIESMYCRTPVISSDCPSGPSEIISHGANGLLFKVGKTSALSSRLKCFYNERNVAEQCIQKGKEKVKQFYLSKIGRQYSTLLETLVRSD